MSIINISNMESFDNLVSSKKSLVIDFTSKWCGPCKRIAPQYVQFAQQMPSLTFCKVDITKCEKLSKRFSIRSVPTFLFINQGQVIEKFTGSDMYRVHSSCKKLMALSS